MRSTYKHLGWVAVALGACGEGASSELAASGADAAAPVGSSGGVEPTRDAGTSGGSARGDAAAAADAADAAAAGPLGQVRGLVGVGYGGLRITSRDGGQSWSSISERNGGGDDYDLLRAVAWANGTWLAVGWSATTSSDGVSWTPLARINEPGGATWEGAESCGLVEALSSDDSYFYVACAEYGEAHHTFRSADGIHWTDLGRLGEVGGHASLAYRDGTFFAYGDPKTSFRSSDAVTWTVDALQEATYCDGAWKSLEACHDASWFHGAYFRSEWQSKVTRSTSGDDFVVVHDDPSNNSLYRPRALAAGWVAP